MTLQQALVHPFFFDTLNKGQMLKSSFEFSFTGVLSKVKKLKKLIETYDIDTSENMNQNGRISLKPRNSVDKSLQKTKIRVGRQTILKRNFSLKNKKIKINNSNNKVLNTINNSPIKKYNSGSLFKQPLHSLRSHSRKAFTPKNYPRKLNFGTQNMKFSLFNNLTPRRKQPLKNQSPKEETTPTWMHSFVSQSDEFQKISMGSINPQNMRYNSSKALNMRSKHNGNSKHTIKRIEPINSKKSLRNATIHRGHTGEPRRNTQDSKDAAIELVQKKREGFFGFLVGLVCQDMRVC